jgi:hypothetical protein
MLYVVCVTRSIVVGTNIGAHNTYFEKFMNDNLSL